MIVSNLGVGSSLLALGNCFSFPVCIQKGEATGMRYDALHFLIPYYCAGTRVGEAKMSLLQSKLLKGGYIGHYVGEYCGGYSGGY